MHQKNIENYKLDSKLMNLYNFFSTICRTYITNIHDTKQRLLMWIHSLSQQEPRSNLRTDQVKESGYKGPYKAT